MINERTVERRSKKTKGGIKMRKLIIGMMVVGLVGMMAGGVQGASTDAADINLFITPIVTVILDVSPTYYDFGSVEMETSTKTLNALAMTNDGNVGFTVEKAVWDDGGWDVTASSTTTDGFDLWAMVNNTQPTLANFVTAVSSFNESGTGNDTYMNALTDITPAQVEMSPTDTENLWFRIDMPQYVTTEAQQKIQVRLKATSK